MTPPEPTLITVLRHGAVAGRPHVLRGRLDAPLSPAGEAASAAALGRLAAPPFDLIASSPQQRCRLPAQAYAQSHGLPLSVWDDFRELDFGDWEGLSPAEAAQRDPEAWSRFQAHAGPAPGGESLADLRSRVTAAWSRWLQDAEGGHRLLLTHAGVMRALLLDLLGLPAGHLWRIAIPEGGYFRVSVLVGHDPVLLALNSCAVAPGIPPSPPLGKGGV